MSKYHAEYPFKVTRGWESIDPETSQVKFTESETGNVMRITVGSLTDLTLTIGAARALSELIDWADFGREAVSRC